MGTGRSTWVQKASQETRNRGRRGGSGRTARSTRPIDWFRYSQNLGVRVNECELGTINLGSGRSMEDVLGSSLSLPYV